MSTATHVGGSLEYSSWLGAEVHVVRYRVYMVDPVSKNPRGLHRFLRVRVSINSTLGVCELRPCPGYTPIGAPIAERALPIGACSRA